MVEGEEAGAPPEDVAGMVPNRMVTVSGISNFLASVAMAVMVGTTNAANLRRTASL